MTFCAFNFVLALAAAAPLPKSASIVDVPAERRGSGIPIGNVRVIFDDGHAEMWTRLGRAEMVKLAKSGLVGWTTFHRRNDRGWEVDDTLRVCWPPDGRHRDFKVESKPFIEAWGFVDGDTAVVIKSRGSHGPAEYVKYRVADGALLGEADAGIDKALPDWAQPYADPD